MAKWEDSVRDNQPTWTVLNLKDERGSDQKHYLLDDASMLAAGFAPVAHTSKFSAETTSRTITAVRLELLNHPELPRGGPGRSIYGTSALTELKLSVQSAGSDQPKELAIASASADVNPPEKCVESIFDNKTGDRRVTGPIGLAIDGDEKTAWDTNVGFGRSNVPRNAVFVLKEPVTVPKGARLIISLVQNHGGANANDNQNNNLGRFRFAVTSDKHATADPVPADLRAIFLVPSSERSHEQLARVFSFWRTTVSGWNEANKRIEDLWAQHPKVTTQLVLTERNEKRTTHRLDRGNYLAPMEEVTSGVPAFLHPLDPHEEGETAPPRLQFARWLASRRSPTTARSIVNRVWQSYFGTGLCETPDDLGTQGSPPSHPELLDWLAIELMEHNWSLKHIHRLIVNSATYHQSGVCSLDSLAKDPNNRLLGRGPRVRVDAEVVRDIALEASGLLERSIGGPSVHPPAPDFLFLPPVSFAPKPWVTDIGPDRYRRGIYTFRFRSVLYPPLQNFDAPNGEISCTRRPQSNTPLQALTLLNEPLFLECARALAERTIQNAGPDDEDRLEYIVRSCLARDPGAEETKILHAFLKKQRHRFERENADPSAVLAAAASGPPNAPPAAGPTAAAELAAWTTVSRVVLSLDATITKE